MALRGRILLLPQFLWFYMIVLGISLVLGRFSAFSLFHRLESYKIQFWFLEFCRFSIKSV
jgi:hypothetical protein